jgi:hypothetical protein
MANIERQDGAGPSLGSAMRRRDFVTLLGSAAATWPLAAPAQQPAMPVVGFLSAGSAVRGPSPRQAAAFRQGLQETGFVESKNVAIEYRWAEDRYDRLPTLAADLIQRKIDFVINLKNAKALGLEIPPAIVSAADEIIE